MMMEKTWRWYGPNDSISLQDIKQAGATGIVTALHDISNGEAWSLEDILARKEIIEWEEKEGNRVPSGLRWSVVESIPVHEDIKQGKPTRDKYIENYKESLVNLGLAGVPTVCYNFMPVVDWTRTNLWYALSDGGRALAFDHLEFAAFDLFILKREKAFEEYSPELREKAKQRFEQLSPKERETLTGNIIAGLPGAEESYTIESFRKELAKYDAITEDQFRENMAYFLREIIPVAEKAGVKMAIHPDDPPRSLFGLPRIVSTEKDLEYLFKVVDSPYNGFTLCAGSLGVREDNDLPGMVRRHGDRLNFVHLRSVARTPEGDFLEVGHLDGDVDMYNLVLEVLREQKRRADKGDAQCIIPMRPDHGHVLLDDLGRRTNPGYSCIGRLRGMAEIRGLELGIIRSNVL